jgi:4-hydroxybenzoate polyprenyltransferase
MAPRSTGLALARLLRLSALPTAMSNILAGFLFTAGVWSPSWLLLATLGISACLYLSGMVLNDVFDVDEDRELRPQRPIPAGLVSLQSARLLGWSLWGTGVGGVLSVGLLIPQFVEGAGRGAWWLIGCGLAGFVVAYNAWLKQTWASPFAMGACRTLNVLLGMAAGKIGLLAERSEFGGSLEFSVIELLVAGLIGLFVMGISVMAKTEAANPNSTLVRIGSVMMLMAELGLISIGGWYLTKLSTVGAIGLLGFIGLGILVLLPLTQRLGNSARHPTEENVQRAVGVGLATLIPLDALVCISARPDSLGLALAVAGLLIPAIILRRWISAT